MTVQPETRIQRAIQKMVKERGGFVFKVHGSETMMVGLMDLICCYHGFFVAFEVKTPTGTVSPAQRLRMRQIIGASGIVTVPRSVADASRVLDAIDHVIINHQDVTDVLRTRFQNDQVWRM
jgi:Archaeal holliday junction resolvase (hjc)